MQGRGQTDVLHDDYTSADAPQRDASCVGTRDLMRVLVVAYAASFSTLGMHEGASVTKLMSTRPSLMCPEFIRTGASATQRGLRGPPVGMWVRART